MGYLLDYQPRDEDKFPRIVNPVKDAFSNKITYLHEKSKQIEEILEKNKIIVRDQDLISKYLKAHSDIISSLFLIIQKVRQLFENKIEIILEYYEEAETDFNCLKFFICLDKEDNFDEMFDKVSDFKAFCAKETLGKTGTIFSELKI